MTYRQIFDEHEGKYRVQDKKIFGEFLESFKEETGIDWKMMAQSKGVSLTDYTTIFWLLHTELFNIEELKSLIPVFYQVLEKYHYNLTEDYVSFIRLIGQHAVHGLPSIVRNFVMKAPYIDEISDNTGNITIYSEKLGKITFFSTKKYFSGNYFIELFLRKNKSEKECHNVSWTLVDYMPGSTLVTSLVPSAFSGTAYHTVIRDRENLIIDVATSCVYEEKDYHNLFQDEIICETKAEEIHSALAETSSLEGEGIANSLVLALHSQQKKL